MEHWSHVLRKIFNANTDKVSYSYMPNISSVIKGHNGQILNKNLQQQTPNAWECNCREYMADAYISDDNYGMNKLVIQYSLNFLV